MAGFTPPYKTQQNKDPYPLEPLKHECGVAMIRLLKPLSYYKERYGTWCYALNKLYLLMEKQHNRGQEGAGIGVVKLQTEPGHEYVWRERAEGSQAIKKIFDTVRPAIDCQISECDGDIDCIEQEVPFLGEISMGHLRYSTTGRQGISNVHPFLRRNNWRSRNLLLCGNFNMTNVDTVFDSIVKKGQHPRTATDTVVLLEQLGYALDKENHRVYRDLRNLYDEPELSLLIEDRMDIPSVLKDAARKWDGGFVICGATGSGDMFALRDSHGIRPAFYYINDEIVVLASERPVIQTVMDIPRRDVQELTPGSALIVDKHGRVDVRDILGCRDNHRCSFERIYFSRGSDADIYRERKALGANLVEPLLKMTGEDIDHTVFSFIPNTAEVAFVGLAQGLECWLDARKSEQILALQKEGNLDADSLKLVMNKNLRIEKVALKDIKLRTFITEDATRRDMAAHVYDVTYGVIENHKDTLVVIDDSIVRGTTLRESILRMLDRLHPKRVIVMSSSPQVRYPDYYGIDMSRLSEFIAFRAAVELLKERGMTQVLDDVYKESLRLVDAPDSELTNAVKGIYAPFTDEEVAAQISKMLTPSDMDAQVDLLFQTVEGLHRAVPDHPGDWYFTGDYPTPGGTRLCLRAFINFYEGNPLKRS